MNVPKATIDFETRSTCSLRACGAWRYSLDPTTEILCLAFRMPGWAEGRTGLWHPAVPLIGISDNAYGDYEDLIELIAYIRSGGIIEAHNAFFERGIWANIAASIFGVVVDGSQWRCSAAKAASHALPRGLDDALAALKLTVRKDVDGGKVMMKMNKPRKPRKAEREAWEAKYGPSLPHKLVYHEDRRLYEELFRYCRQDVLAEEALSAALPDLSTDETGVYLLDQAINERGFQLDSGAVDQALRLIAREESRLTQELVVLTGGVVKKVTARAQLLRWLEDQGCYLPDTQKETVTGVLALTPTLAGSARRALEILSALGRSSTAKYKTMRAHMCFDGRVRGGLLYHGASTGRWSGSGVQPHNFPKGSLKKISMEDVWQTLLSM